MASYGISLRLKGPIVEGRGPAIVKAMTEVAIEELADYTRYEVLMQLDSVLQHPTGYYESQIVKDRVAPDIYSVNDSGVIYGPWLEGIGSRNAPVTKFEGYHTFRTVRNRMAQKAMAISEAAIARQMGALE
ncbi:hypothetical protein EDD90_3307 [Streptomyces sp. Ag109_O5-1]|uniref:hypothetical protein n=1 Tax=Streptomyces sp. Ag109_O5-1 TaxID=1938851 RepID=UPI000F511C7C|nr:hypothetical protein [Streptomyces sp. Ag109_O5-1]RPE40271.1 hypothetical protein EDD90_3307 [Streptomyces sp. Ag109_O5-1]